MSAPDMDPPASARIDLGRLLDAAEAAAPVDAVDAVAAELQHMVGADSVSFLIADFSGDALIRLGHSSHRSASRRAGQDTADRVSLADSPQGRALVRQSVEVATEAGGTWLYAPVTSRGEAV